ncbi:helix-turn-helix domain-containing protein [uncultured Aquimarina sp.]|uniref:helix-turn-helix domain-containing protein n=1 Tax=uncultured Aquimarina sp. TaxID=575652 RepID=UPI00262763EC|nr:helix-turn-helix domain-containing protein [uncultured Aquimarina sp.]
MNTELSRKIKELRTRLGFTQESLAEETKLSLRTIQRIENSESEPRGDTLKKIAGVLKVTPDELMDWSERKDTTFLMVLNVSSLTFLLFPLLGIIVPLIFWVLKRNTIIGADTLGKKILNFQITWSIIFFTFQTLAFLTILRVINIFGDKLPGLGSQFSFLSIIGVLYLINIVFVVYNTYKIKKETEIKYPALRFLR